MTRVAVLALALLLAWFDLADFDLGLARATGGWIVEQGDVPRTNVFSELHHDRPFVDDKWLFHVFAYAVVDGLGEIGPHVAVALRAALVLLLAALLLRPVGGSAATAPAGAVLVDRAAHERSVARLAAVPFALLALVASHERFAFRPELFTLPFLAIFVHVTTRAAAPSRREVALLLVLQAAWANLHGYFVLGPIVAAAALCGAWLDRVLAARVPGRLAAAPGDLPLRRVLLPVALIAACFANPYGWKLVVSPLEILLDLRRNFGVYGAAIVEFEPPFAPYAVLPADLAAYRVLLGGAAAALLCAGMRVPFVQLAPLALLFAMSLDIRRNVALFAVAAAPICARWVALGAVHLAGRGGAAARGAATLCAGLALPAAAWLGFLQATDRLPVHDRLERRLGSGESATAYPTAEIDFVLRELPPGRLFNSFSFGSTFTGRAFPGRTAFIDGNTAGYDVSFLAACADFVQTKGDPEAYVRAHGIDQFLLKPGHPITAWLVAREEYVPVFVGRHAVVVVARSPKHAAVIERHDLRRAASQGGDAFARARPPATPRSTFWRATFPLAELNVARFLAALASGTEEPAGAGVTAHLLERAAAECEQALAVNDALFEPWHELGLLRFRLGDLAGARAALSEAIERAPRAAQPAADRGLVAWSARDFAAALRDLSRAAVLDARLAVVPFRMALALRDRDLPGDRERALREVRRSVALDPSHAPARALLEQLERGG